MKFYKKIQSLLNTRKNIQLFYLILLTVFTSVLFTEELKEKPLVVITPSYNNIRWYKKNLESILSQKYSNFRVIYLDDHSNDGTSEAVQNYVKQIGQESRLKLIENKKRKGSLANIYEAIQSCSDDEIALIVDGDDWLYDNMVLKKINEVYQNENIWLTHGTLMEYPSGNVAWCLPIPKFIIEKNQFRSFRCPSHLRTFYVWLFKKINVQDLMLNGVFFPMTGDQAIMFPMIEMAGERHAFIEDIVYIYNMENSLNDNKINAELQREIEKIIRSKPAYTRLN